MPYKNIVFVKLEKRLLNDHRWFGMSEQSQLLYIKLILAAAETYNKIPAKIGLLTSLLRTKQRESTIIKCIKEIQEQYPKFKKNGEFYYFEGFDEKTNYIRASQRNAQVVPKVGADIDIDKEEDKEKDIYALDLPKPPEEPYIKEKETFDIFRKKYYGKKLGLDTEFKNFRKKHKDWKKILPLLLPAVEKQIEEREELKKLAKKDRNIFVPFPKHLKTWINNNGWEEETVEETTKGEEYKIL